MLKSEPMWTALLWTLAVAAGLAALGFLWICALIIVETYETSPTREHARRDLAKPGAILLPFGPAVRLWVRLCS